MTTRNQLAAIALLTFGPFQTVPAQDIQVSKANKTIEVTVTGSVEADPEAAIIEIGYRNYGRTRETVFEENVRTSNQIMKSLLQAGVVKENIETERLRLERVESDAKLPAEVRSERQFEAAQSWDVHVRVSRAQAVVDLAVKSGANNVQEIEWTVRDPDALENKASVAALTKARALAEQMVKGLGAKLGDLLYASNTSRRPKGWPFASTLNSEVASLQRKELQLTLFPKKVEREATVHAIFAIE